MHVHAILFLILSKHTYVLLTYTSVLSYVRTFVTVFPSVLLGPTPAYVIADMDLFREITVKHFDKFTDRIVSATCITTP